MNRYLTPAITSIAVFLLCISILFVEQKSKMNSVVLYVCLGYALLCLFFLFFQIYAFFKAHTDYDPEVEEAKYQVFDAEDVEFVREEII